MAKLSARRAALAGFRLAVRRPFAVLAWGIVYFCLALLPAALIARAIGGQTFLGAPVIQQFRMIRGVLQWTTFLGSAVIYAAVFRAMLSPKDRGVGALGLGGAEVRQGLLLVCRALLLGLVVFLAVLATLFAVFAARLAPSPYSLCLQAAAVIAATGLCIWIWARLSMAAPMTFADGRFRLFESWGFTRGQAAKLVWLAVLSALTAAIAEAVALVALLGLAELSAELGKWRMQSVTAVLHAPADFVIDAPYLIAAGLAFSVASAFVICAAIAPWAEAYRMMADMPEEVAARPEADRFEAGSVYARVPGSARLPTSWSAPAALLFLVALAMGTETMLLVIGMAGLGALGWKPGEGAAARWAVELAMTAILDVVLVLTVLAWARVAERRPLASAGFTRGPKAGDAVWFLVGVAWALALAVGLALRGAPGQLPTSWTIPAALVVQAPITLATILGMAFTEEVLFRGWLLSALAPRIGPILALVFSSVVFAALHVLPWELADPARALSFVSYVFTGVTMGCVALSQRQIWSSTAIHAGYNSLIVFTALLVQGSTPKGVWTQLVEQRRGTSVLDEALTLVAINAVVAAVMFGLWRWKHRKGAPRTALREVKLDLEEAAVQG
jgi:membrane protease YdiL (CAAX protease family)